MCFNAPICRQPLKYVKTIPQSIISAIPRDGLDNVPRVISTYLPGCLKMGALNIHSMISFNINCRP